MRDHHFRLSEAQFSRLQSLLPNKPRGVPRVDDCRVISGIIHVLRHGLMWRDAPAEYGPHKTLYNRFVRWSEKGVFDRIAEKGYDSDHFRQALLDLDIQPFIPGRSNRKEPVEYDKELYKQRNLIERMFGRMKDWRRIATRYDRCAHTFFSAICIAATVIYWL
jgi:transposase